MSKRYKKGMVDCHEMFQCLYQMPQDILKSLFGYDRVDYIIVNYEVNDIAWIIHMYNKKNLPRFGDIVYQKQDDKYLGCVTQVSDIDNKAHILWQDGSNSFDGLYTLIKTGKSLAPDIKNILTEIEGILCK